jgi:hypothetical protein
MNEILAYLTHNPLVALYTLQAATYAAAAALSHHAGHKDLCICYSASALLHGGFATCHLMHVA